MVFLICNSCKEEKPMEDFVKNKKIKRGYNLQCKSCKNSIQKQYGKNNSNKYTKLYEKSKKGFLMRVYRNMLSRVRGIQKKSKHLYNNLEILNKEDFYNWAINRKDFNVLFDAYENSGYVQKICPSIDRIDSDKGYVIENMRWLTLSENSRLGAISDKRGNLI